MYKLLLKLHPHNNQKHKIQMYAEHELGRFHLKATADAASALAKINASPRLKERVSKSQVKIEVGVDNVSHGLFQLSSPVAWTPGLHRNIFISLCFEPAMLLGLTIIGLVLGALVCSYRQVRCHRRKRSSHMA